MSDDLKQKIMSWMEPDPPAYLPIQAAAVLLSAPKVLKPDLEQGNSAVAFSMDALDRFMPYLYCSEMYLKTGFPFSEKALKKLYRETGVLKHQIWDGQHFDDDYLDCFFEADGKDFKSFINRAERVAALQPRSFDEIEDVLNYFRHHPTLPNFLTDISNDTYGAFWGPLCGTDHPLGMLKENALFAPEKGPKAVHEIYAIVGHFFISARQMKEETGNQLFERLYDITERFTTALCYERADMGSDAIIEWIKRDHSIMEELWGQHGFGVEHLIGWTSHFLHYADDKMTDTLRFQTFEFLFDLTHWMCTLRYGQQGYDLQNAAARIAIGERRDEIIEMHFSYDKPSVEEVVQGYKKAILNKYSRKKGQRLVDQFEKALAEMPDQMEQAVVYYYPVLPDIKKVRDFLFKRTWGRDGEETAKPSFIKHVANTNPAALLSIGLRHQDILHMQETGKVPANENGERYPLTVEHIHDREYGGTHHFENLILMHERINAAKDSLKRVQLCAFPEEKKEGWIVTWVPRRDEDTNYPLVLDVPVVG